MYRFGFRLFPFLKLTVFNLTITYHTGKVEKRPVRSFQALENGVVNYVNEDGVGFGRIYPDDGTVIKVEIEFDRPAVLQ